MVRPIEKAEQIKKEARSLNKQVSKAYKLVEAFDSSNEKANELRNFMTEQSASQFNGALATGAHSLQKILQGTYSGKISTAKALEGIQTINISVMTAEMVAAEILGENKKGQQELER